MSEANTLPKADLARAEFSMTSSTSRMRALDEGKIVHSQNKDRDSFYTNPCLIIWNIKN